MASAVRFWILVATLSEVSERHLTSADNQLTNCFGRDAERVFLYFGVLIIRILLFKGTILGSPTFPK